VQSRDLPNHKGHFALCSTMLSNQVTSSSTPLLSRMESRLLPPRQDAKHAKTKAKPSEQTKPVTTPYLNSTKQNNIPRRFFSRSPIRNRPEHDAPLPATRHERASFQGLGIVNGKGKKPSTTSFDPLKVEQMKYDRRRKSMDIMRKSAQTSQIRQMLENTLDDCVTAINTEGTAEERLKNVLTKAKETGMTADEIFSFFNGGNPNTTQITTESFLSSIEKLGDTFLVLTDDELRMIVKKFDKNDDGKISIAEFKNYCYYNIHSVAWKAERTRLEKSGEMKMLQAQLSRRFKPGDNSDDSDCGEEVHRTSKFFWKTNNNVEIRIFFTEILNVVTLQLYSQTNEFELPNIFICKNKVDLERKEKLTKNSQELEDANLKEAGEEATWDSVAKYLVARLQLWERKEDECNGDAMYQREENAHISPDIDVVPFLSKLSGKCRYFAVFSFGYTQHNTMQMRLLTKK